MANFHTQIIKPGFPGIAEVGGRNIRCSSFSMNPNQETLFYNHVIGLNDTVPTDTTTKGEAVGVIQPQRFIWRPSPLGITGWFSYPACYNNATSGNILTLFEHAKRGTYFDFNYSFYCNKRRVFTGCRINTWTLSMTQGDIVQISTDIYCKKEVEDSTTSNYTTVEKFVTWDKANVSVAGLTDPIQSFELTINNGAKYIYVNNSSTAGVTANHPADIRLGMQEVSGNITFYLKQPEIFLDATTGITPITVTLPGLVINITAVLRNDQVEGVVGPIVTTIPFVGVDKALGA